VPRAKISFSLGTYYCPGHCFGPAAVAKNPELFRGPRGALWACNSAIEQLPPRPDAMSISASAAIIAMPHAAV